MNKAFEKILERLEELKGCDLCNGMFCSNCEEKYGGDDCGVRQQSLAIDECKAIVHEVVEEYNNGWIPCSERLPEERDSVFAKFKGTDKWNRSIFEKTSDIVNVTVSDKKGNVATTHARTVDGKWSCDLLRMNKNFRIIAWQPLPEPYKGVQVNGDIRG